MKQKFYIFGAMLCCIAFFSSYSGGYAALDGEGLTGAPGDTKLANGSAKTCQFCHNNGGFNPSASLELLNEAGTAAVTSYETGKIYTIRFTVTPGAGVPVGYGFQMIDIQKSNNANVKGFVSTQATGIRLSTIANGRIYAEQSNRSVAKTFNIKWKAPTVGVGTVTFYAVGNTVNGNGDSSGDNGTSSVQLDFPQMTSGVNELAAQVYMSVAPNPTTEGVVLTLMSKAAKKVQIRLNDLNGQTVIMENWQIQTGENIKTLDINRLAKGAYMIQIIENQNVITKKIIKL